MQFPNTGVGSGSGSIELAMEFCAKGALNHNSILGLVRHWPSPSYETGWGTPLRWSRSTVWCSGLTHGSNAHMRAHTCGRGNVTWF